MPIDSVINACLCWATICEDCRNWTCQPYLDCCLTCFRGLAVVTTVISILSFWKWLGFLNHIDTVLIKTNIIQQLMDNCKIILDIQNLRSTTASSIFFPLIKPEAHFLAQADFLRCEKILLSPESTYYTTYAKQDMYNLHNAIYIWVLSIAPEHW